MSEIKLNPCPFCGTQAVEIWATAGMFRVVCPKCRCTTEHKFTQQQAADVWNRRALE